MVITNYDKFALTPKRCDNCNTLFIFEMYNVHYKLVGLGQYDLKQIKCKRCIKLKEV